MPSIEVTAQVEMRMRSFDFVRARSAVLQRLAAVLCAAALISIGCGDPEPRTEVVLVIDADPDLRRQINGLRVDVRGYAADENGRPDSSSDVSKWNETYSPLQADLGGWPHNFAFTPRDGDPTRLYEVSVIALDGEEPLSLLRVSSGFRKGKTLQIALRFTSACLGDKSLNCETDETCAAGECVSARLPPSRLPDFGSGRDQSPAVNPAPEVDAGPPDSPSSPEAGAGAAGSNASDPACGNGQLDDGEACDTGIAAGEPDACPTECPSESAGAPRRLSGQGCEQICEAAPEITELVGGDGCCPLGASANDDVDCGTLCGNARVESGETCDPIDTCPSADTCKAANPCLSAAISGKAELCTAVCSMQPITKCGGGDGCCPAGCTRADDNDCSATCGDGMIDTASGETCEAGSAMLCSVSCNDDDPCTTDMLTGSPENCNTSCTHTPIATPLAGDSCCPAGANSNTDADCAPICGNRVLEMGERCDGDCPESCDDSLVCTADALAGTACQRQCTHTQLLPNPTVSDRCCPSGATAAIDVDCMAVCGNGMVETGERCDGNCPNAAACNDNDACTTDSVMGMACARQCAHTPISMASMTADGCCPMGATSATDPDCPTSCGNMVVDANEACDDGNTMSSDGCSAVCQLDDDARTPGDDRRGFVSCGAGVGPRPACTPDQLCCLQTDSMTPSYACVAPGGTCESRFACDGPEDCSDSQVCCQQTSESMTETILCRTASECTGMSSKIVCHTDDSGFCAASSM
jgi:cysteine-rich repeat protein